MTAARELAARMAAAAPLATRAVKAIVAATEGLAVDDAYRALSEGSIPAYDRALASEDAREGPRAFSEGRSPEWKGR
jgi:crotonobetainyl-CoA hydratase